MSKKNYLYGDEIACPDCDRKKEFNVNLLYKEYFSDTFPEEEWNEKIFWCNNCGALYTRDEMVENSIYNEDFIDWIFSHDVTKEDENE